MADEQPNPPNADRQSEHQTQEGATEPRATDRASGATDTVDQVDVNAELSHITSSSVNIAGGHVINIRLDSSEQARKILRDIYEGNLASQLPRKPPADADLQDQVDYWFKHGLKTDDEKLFAIALTIFSGIKYPDLRDIFSVVKAELVIKDEGHPYSPFRTSDDDLIKTVKAQTRYDSKVLEEIIEFCDEKYPDAVFTTLRKQYRGVLLDLLPALKLIVERYRYWEIRYRAALSIAEIGKLGFQRVRSKILDLWAIDSRAYVRASVGYPLALLAQDVDCRSAVEKVLSDWCNPSWNHSSNDAWRYRWTAASTFKQIGLINEDWAQQWAYKGLRTLAGFDDIRIADSVIHSLVVLSLQRQLEKILLLIKVWIEQGSAGSSKDVTPQARCIVGILGFFVLSQIHVELAIEEEQEAEAVGIQVNSLFHLVRQSSITEADFWQLVIAVGVRSFEFRLANEFFSLVSDWTHYAADNPTFQNTVRNLLFEVYVKVRPKQREHILNRLKRWELQSKDAQLAQMATSTKAKIQEYVNGAVLPRIVFGQSPDD
jgi:hypothetical protein